MLSLLVYLVYLCVVCVLCCPLAAPQGLDALQAFGSRPIRLWQCTISPSILHYGWYSPRELRQDLETHPRVLLNTQRPHQVHSNEADNV